MNNQSVVITSSSLETQKLGEKFASQLQGENIVCLYGDLGSGKTTFVQGLAKGLRIQSRIISPTFVLIRQHKIKVQNSKFKIQNLYHVDLYRLDNERSMQEIGLKDLFEDKNSIVVIEWAEKLGALLPKKRWDVKFEHEDENSRKIRIDYIEG